MQSKGVGSNILKCIFFISSLIAVLFFARNSQAQVNTASLSGTVTDASGAAVPGATVTATSTETSTAHTATTNDTGFYQILALPVGRYDVKVEKDGFKTSIQTGVNLVVGQQGVINLSMQVGQINQQVTVSGEAAMVVNTTTASVAGLVNEQQVKDLPLNGRSFDQLITLNAGTNNFTALRVSGGSGTAQGNRFSVSGRRPSENYFLLNGVELAGPNQDQTIPWGVSGELLGVDSIREFNVMQTAYGAEYGKKAGGQVSIVTQSGTNQLHGTLFEFLRNSVFDAQEYNNNNAGGIVTHNPIPPFKRNQFGGSAGGPIIKDKTFIFGNYEGLRFRLGETVSAVVPDTNARNGLLPDGVTPIPGAVTTGGPGGHGMLDYVRAYWPAPTAACAEVATNEGIGQASCTSNPLEPIREDYGVLRLDHNISSKDTLAAVYTIDNGYQVAPLPDPIFTNDVALDYKVFSLAETHTFSPSTLNTFTFGFSHVDLDFAPSSPTVASNLFLVNGQYAAGFITVGLGSGGGGGATSGIVSGGSSTGSGFIDHKSLFTYADQVSMVRGKNQFTYGVWFQRQRDNGSGNSTDLGRANFSDYLSLFSGQIGGAGLIAVPNEITHQWRQWVGAWFVQDQIQLKPNLTLRVGLRHEFTNGWNDPSGRASNFIYSNGIVQTNPLVGTSALTQNNAKLLFSPRIGLAWDVRGDGKTSVRASFGTYYDIQDDFTTIELAAAPFNNAVTYTNVNFLSSVPFIPGTAEPPPCNGSNGPTCLTNTPRGFQPNFKTPTVEEWEVSVERQLSSSMSLRVAYDGSEGFHQVIISDPNTIAPLVCSTPPCTAGGLNATTSTVTTSGTVYVPTGVTRPNPFLGNGSYYFQFGGTASYNAVLTEITKRVGSGLEFKANYTYSHALDEGSGEGLGQGANTTNIMTPYNVRFDRGPSAHDFTHQASISGTYDLPFGHGRKWLANSSGIVDKLAGGWQINTIVTLSSGYPLILTDGSNVSGNGDATAPDRPNYAPGFTSIPTSGVLPSACGKFSAGTPLGSATLWYDPCAVAKPQLGTWGNVPVGALRGPGVADMDMSFFKNISFSERYRLQFRAEMFNIVNHPNLGLPNTSAFGSVAGNINSQATAYAVPAREIQFGLKLNF